MISCGAEYDEWIPAQLAAESLVNQAGFTVFFYKAPVQHKAAEFVVIPAIIWSVFSIIFDNRIIPIGEVFVYSRLAVLIVYLITPEESRERLVQAGRGEINGFF